MIPHSSPASERDYACPNCDVVYTVPDGRVPVFPQCPTCGRDACSACRSVCPCGEHICLNCSTEIDGVPCCDDCFTTYRRIRTAIRALKRSGELREAIIGVVTGGGA